MLAALAAAQLGFFSGLKGQLEHSRTCGLIRSVISLAGWPQRIWEEVGKKKAYMKILFQLEREASVSREARAKLSNLMQDRNQIAHPSVSTIFPDADQVIDYISFLIFLLKY